MRMHARAHMLDNDSLPGGASNDSKSRAVHSKPHMQAKQAKQANQNKQNKQHKQSKQ
jgi:hypothetical protein